ISGVEPGDVTSGPAVPAMTCDMQANSRPEEEQMTRTCNSHQRMAAALSRALVATALALSLGGFALPGTALAEVLKFGLSLPLSGPAASYGLTTEWVAKQAA